LVLGNHDYGHKNSVESQLKYTNFKSNPDKLWQMPALNYTFSKPLKDGSVDFFAYDSNPISPSLFKRNPELYKKQILNSKEWLKNSLAESKATWKIVYAHHPMYTSGAHHGQSGMRLRLDEYIDYKDQPEQGYGFESLLIDAKVDVYFSGHEHVMQAHQAKGIHHFVVGCVSRGGLYGKQKKIAYELDFCEPTLEKSGFSVTYLHSNYIEVKLVDSQLNVLYEVRVDKPNPHSSL